MYRTCYCLSSLNSIDSVNSVSGGSNVNNLNKLMAYNVNVAANVQIQLMYKLAGRVANVYIS